MATVTGTVVFEAKTPGQTTITVNYSWKINEVEAKLTKTMTVNVK